mmetsp:Transcript_8418/g.12819  ORF Transcript_8418/g.12819 Transcript_8418/m.12819 type:complete len:107 (+) Transcript_8418:794-1114(+)|eukprot:CAMPEP_0170500742 /NCGR_PEP_ID=MMETSP0208-20121228/35877_1 /TAXON_ID=197538 /ORGANISM="Strombidium inclinatum, Strain S3" /LENGTH=106 /DNA_ID=CAMNT_0010778915 /DNA_START=688 /DNA_END=1008 /DNA_ORIENTATION=-
MALLLHPLSPYVFALKRALYTGIRGMGSLLISTAYDPPVLADAAARENNTTGLAMSIAALLLLRLYLVDSLDLVDRRQLLHEGLLERVQGLSLLFSEDIDLQILGQ